MKTAFYASGAYRRERFDKPLSHYPIYAAMISSAAAGNRWFDLGDVSLSPRMSDKERSISYFKRGFSSHLKVDEPTSGRMGPGYHTRSMSPPPSKNCGASRVYWSRTSSSAKANSRPRSPPKRRKRPFWIQRKSTRQRNFRDAAAVIVWPM
jgi:hypothetical protein